MRFSSLSGVVGMTQPPSAPSRRYRPPPGRPRAALARPLAPPRRRRAACRFPRRSVGRCGCRCFGPGRGLEDRHRLCADPPSRPGPSAHAAPSPSTRAVPAKNVIDGAAGWTELLAGLLSDHDLLLIDPRGTGRSHPLNCGLGLPATRQRYVRAIGRCGKRLGRPARAYTSAATADDFEAVRALPGHPEARPLRRVLRHLSDDRVRPAPPASVRSIVLSSAFPLRFDMWARAARGMRLAIRRVCARSTTGNCNGARSLRQLGRLATACAQTPSPTKSTASSAALSTRPHGRHRLRGRRRHRPASGDRGAALRSDTGPLIEAASALAV